jgi:cytochrome c-type biogenesis protein
MDTLFTTLSQAVAGAPLVALLAAAAWGILSVLLSPCHLASIPLVVGYVEGQGIRTARRAFPVSVLFATGILLTIGLVGVLTALAGRMMGDLGGYVNYLVAAILFVFGLSLLDVIPLPGWGAVSAQGKRKGLLGAFLLGLIFGLALGPCTFAYMAPMLAVVLRVASAHPVYAASLLLCYGLGHCLVIVLAGTSTGAVQGYLDWNQRSGLADRLRKTCGVLVLAAGVYMIYVAP